MAIFLSVFFVIFVSANALPKVDGSTKRERKSEERKIEKREVEIEKAQMWSAMNSVSPASMEMIKGKKRLWRKFTHICS